MQIATETERKYDVPEGFELPSLTGTGGIAGIGGAETHHLDATYFDTDDLTLMQNRRTLRRRTGGSDAGWHLKTPASAGSRTEHRLPLDGPIDQVPGELAGQVRALVRRKPLKPVARLRTRRIETALRDGEGRVLAVVAQDTVKGESAGRKLRWQELEVELVDGGEDVLQAVERRLLAAGATPAAGPSKVGRVIGTPHQPKVTFTDPVFGYARDQRDVITESDPAVRQGDPEAVHKMRVATRRLRSTLKTFKRTFPASSFVQGELKWLAALLGQVRDGQVQEGKLLAPLANAGPQLAEPAATIKEHLDRQVADGRAALEEAFDGDRYLTLLDRIDKLTATDHPAADSPLPRARKIVHKSDKLLDQALADGEDAELHEARKSYKRARYAVEVAAPDAKRFLKSLTNLQDVLGAHQDSVVARELLHELGPDNFWFGVLYGRQEQIGRETYARLPVVVERSRKKKLRKCLG